MVSRRIFFSRTVCFLSGSCSICCTSAYQSRSMRYSARRNCARVTGSTGIRGGCGKRSSRYSMITRESYSTRSRSTSVGTLWYGLRSSRSSGNLPGSTLTMSMLMPFSASTMRVRWLHGSLGAEKSVMMDRLLDKMAALKAQSLGRSMDVFPVFLLQKPREPGEDEQEQDDPHAERAALHLHGLADVVQEVHGITDERIVLRFREPPRYRQLELLQHLL